MKLKKFEENIKTPLRKATVMLLLKQDEVLLAMKKRGFGVGKWNGPGGKVNSGEQIIEAAIRETEEEIKATPLNPRKVAIMKYLFPYQESWGQEVHIFTTEKWKGKISETEEMKPKWFKKNSVPFGKMWVDDLVWMPRVFAGEMLKGSFLFDKEKMLEYYLVKVTGFE